MQNIKAEELKRKKLRIRGIGRRELGANLMILDDVIFLTAMSQRVLIEMT
jgi:hypothetical protein